MKDLKTREWLFLLSIIILIQFIIQIGAWLYGTSASALGYISFAGTAISIVLAVLAIIYSFVQSYSQERTASNISSQVEKLMTVADNMTSSKNEMKHILQHLTKVSEKVDLSIERQHELEESVKSLDGNFKEYFTAKVDYYSEELQNTDDIHSLPIAGGEFQVLTSCLYAYIAEIKKIPYKNIKEEIIRPYLQQFILKDDLESTIKYSFNTFSGVALTLRSYGSIQILNDEDEKIVLHENFRESCTRLIKYIIEKGKKDDRDLLYSLIQKFKITG